MTPKQKWSHMTGHIPGKILIWPKIVTPVTSAHNSPSTNFLWIWHITAACDKIAHTVSPNHMGKIQLPRTSMPLMTPFHHSQFPSPILVEVGQLIPEHFQMCPKIMTSHHFKCKKATEWNTTPKQKWSHMTGHIPGKILIWPKIVTPVTSAHNSPSTNFLWIWHITAACDKIAHTVFPNHMGQTQLPQASMPLMTPFTTHSSLLQYWWK